MKNYFKSAFVFRLLDELVVPALIQALEKFPHREPAALELSQYGFVPPFGASLVEEPKPRFIVLACKESYRDLPASVVNDAVQQEVEAIRDNEGRPVGRKERQALKDDAVFALMPKCFIKHRITYAMVIGGLLIIEASSARQAEEFCSRLREALGGLKAIPLTPDSAPTQVMTRWVREGIDCEQFALGERCQLVSSRTSSKVNVKDLELDSAEVAAHIDAGLYVQKLTLSFNDRIAFDVDDCLHMRRIRFDDSVMEAIDEHAGDSESPRDYAMASMLIAGSELYSMIAGLVEQFGGERAEGQDAA